MQNNHQTLREKVEEEVDLYLSKKVPMENNPDGTGWFLDGLPEVAIQRIKFFRLNPSDTSDLYKKILIHLVKKQDFDPYLYETLFKGLTKSFIREYLIEILDNCSRNRSMEECFPLFVKRFSKSEQEEILIEYRDLINKEGSLWQLRFIESYIAVKLQKPLTDEEIISKIDENMEFYEEEDRHLLFWVEKIKNQTIKEEYQYKILLRSLEHGEAGDICIKSESIQNSNIPAPERQYFANEVDELSDSFFKDFKSLFSTKEDKIKFTMFLEEKNGRYVIEEFIKRFSEKE